MGAAVDATGTGGTPSRNATSSGARVKATTKTADARVTRPSAGFQARGALERLPSSIWDTRRVVCRILLTAACASARPRRMKLFSATVTRHSAYARGSAVRASTTSSQALSRSSDSCRSTHHTRMEEQQRPQYLLRQFRPVVAALQMGQFVNQN